MTLAALTSPCTAKIHLGGRVSLGIGTDAKMPRRQTKRGNAGIRPPVERKAGNQANVNRQVRPSPNYRGFLEQLGLPGPFGSAQIDLPESAGMTYGCHNSVRNGRLLGQGTGCRHPWRAFGMGTTSCDSTGRLWEFADDRKTETNLPWVQEMAGDWIKIEGWSAGQAGSSFYRRRPTILIQRRGGRKNCFGCRNGSTNTLISMVTLTALRSR